MTSLAETTRQELSQTRAELEDVRSDLARQRTGSASMAQEAVASESVTVALRSDLETARQEVAMLGDRVRAGRVERNHLDSMVDGLRDELSTSRIDLEEARRTAGELERARKSVQAELESVVAGTVESDRELMERGRQAAGNAEELERVRDLERRARSEVEEMGNRLKEAQAINCELEKRYQELQTQASLQRGHLNKELAEQRRR
jgi:chromosome segregation ATPase